MIPQWKETLKDEHKTVNDIHESICNGIRKFAAESLSDPPKPGAWVDRHRAFIKSLHDLAGQLETLIEAQHVRANTLAVFYDVAQKEQGSVLDVYEKLEECTEILRSEAKDVTKKLYSFSTLEMEYYEKLLQVYDTAKHEDETYATDYADMRVTLNGIYRHDQYHIVILQLETIFASIDNTFHKFVAILQSNQNTLHKMFEGSSNPMLT